MANILITFKISNVFRASRNGQLYYDGLARGSFIASFVRQSTPTTSIFVRNIGSWHDATRSTLLHTGLLLLVLGHACDYQR